MGEYVVVMRGPSGIRFRMNETLAVEATSQTGPLQVSYRTRYSDEGFGPLPRELATEIRGPAGSLDDAVQLFANVARAFVPLLALCVNVPIDDADVELAYEVTPGQLKREFFQQFLPSETGLPKPGRHPPGQATADFITQVSTHPERDRIFRAASQYHLALGHIRSRRSILALAHLFMGMEALAVAAVRMECHRRGISEEDLAATFGVEPNTNQLAAAVRREILFRGDADCHRKAKQASDGFEHGFSGYESIRMLVADSLDKTASYLRSSIFDVAGVDEATKRILLAPPYDAPLDTSPIEKRIRGHLISEEEIDNLAASDQRYPIFRWRTKITDIKPKADESGFDVSWDESLTAALAPSVKFQGTSFQIWGPPLRTDATSQGTITQSVDDSKEAGPKDPPP